MRPPLGFRRATVGLLLIAFAALAACDEISNPAGPDASPPPTGASGNASGLSRTIVGEVLEADGPPLADVRIGTSAGGTYRPLAKTASDGSFRLEQFTGESLMFDRPGYASALWTVPAGAGARDTIGIAIRIQPWLFVSAAAPLSARLSDDDATFASGDSLFEMGDYACHPCKMAMVSDGSRDPVTLRLTWTGDLPLSLWVGDGYSPPSLFTPRAGANEITAVINDHTYVSQLLVGVDKRTAKVASKATGGFTLAIERSSFVPASVEPYAICFISFSARSEASLYERNAYLPTKTSAAMATARAASLRLSGLATKTR